jgi:transcriptional regulator with XRE-family HTH domain
MSTLGHLLRRYRQRGGLSVNALARAVGIDGSYISRLENEQREPPRRPIVDSLARALGLGREDTNRLLVAAGYVPEGLLALGAWDGALQDVLDVLSAPDLAPRDVARFRETVRLLRDQWCGARAAAGDGFWLEEVSA